MIQQLFDNDGKTVEKERAIFHNLSPPLAITQRRQGCLQIFSWPINSFSCSYVTVPIWVLDEYSTVLLPWPSEIMHQQDSKIEIRKCPILNIWMHALYGPSSSIMSALTWDGHLTQVDLTQVTQEPCFCLRVVDVTHPDSNHDLGGSD